MKGDKDDSMHLKRSRIVRDFILDAPREELKEALEADGEDFESLARRGEAVIQKALGSWRTKGNKDQSEDLHRGLGMLIQLLRRSKQLSEEELAERARIETDEIRRMESDPKHSPSPRTIDQLEQYFKLPERVLVVLSGAVRIEGEEFREGVLRFAAQAHKMGKLSREEKRLLNSFVKYLRDHVR